MPIAYYLVFMGVIDSCITLKDSSLISAYPVWGFLFSNSILLESGGQFRWDLELSEKSLNLSRFIVEPLVFPEVLNRTHTSN